MLAGGSERSIAVQLKAVDEVAEHADVVPADQPVMRTTHATPGTMSRTDHLLKLLILLGSCAIVISGLIALIV